MPRVERAALRLNGPWVISLLRLLKQLGHQLGKGGWSHQKNLGNWCTVVSWGETLWLSGERQREGLESLPDLISPHIHMVSSKKERSFRLPWV